MYLLDTNVVSELRKAASGKADKNVTLWASNIPSNQLYISVVTILEVEMGVLAKERTDEHQGEVLRKWLDHVVTPAFAERTLVFDEKIARCCANLQIPDRRSERDAMIAATGIIHNMTIVTRNLKDFLGTGVKLYDPWSDDIQEVRNKEKLLSSKDKAN